MWERQRTERDKFFKPWTEQLIIMPVLDLVRRLIESGHLAAACEGHIEESKARSKRRMIERILFCTRNGSG